MLRRLCLCQRLIVTITSASLQKHWIPRFTKAGFKKTRAPPLLFALLKVCAVSAVITVLPPSYLLHHDQR
jgi:hypothetical protein